MIFKNHGASSHIVLNGQSIKNMESSGIEAALLVIASAFAVAINTITGGGSLITLPVLLAVGIPIKQSVGVNMVALAIGGVGSVFGGFESFKRNSTKRLLVLLPTSLGAALGSILLLEIPADFLESIIPVLVLIATLSLFIPRKLWHFKNRWAWSSLAIFLVSIYGGFFGAGMGVMLVSVLTIFSYGEFHALNSLKNLQQVFINSISATILLTSGLVLFEPTLFMILGGLSGGYFTGKFLERISERNLRVLMIAIGLFLSILLFLEFLVS